MPLPKVKIAGLPLVRVNGAGLAKQLLADWRAQRKAGGTLLPKLVFSVNGQGLALCRQKPAYKKLMLRADYLHADGQSVVLASRLLTPCPIAARTATTDFFHDAAKVAEAEGLRFYMLGAKEENNAKAVAAVQAMYPKLHIVGRQHGYVSDWEPVVRKIAESRPDVVWLALGKPKQEELCAALQKQLIGVTWLKPCGGLFEFLAGDRKARRAPVWMQRAGLEWFFRMVQDPKRLWKRYATTNVIAAWDMLRDSGRWDNPKA